MQGKTVLLTKIRKNSSKLCAVTAGLIPFIVYLRTLCPTVYALDSAELTVGAYTLGLVHAPGYPLYLFIGKLFTFLPIGDVGYRMNLMSAFFATLTIIVLYYILYHLTSDALVSLTAALFFAFSYYFWTSAVVAEVYTLHTFLMATQIWLLLHWRATRRDRWLYTFAFIFALSMGNHTSTILQSAAFTYFVLATDWKILLQPRKLLVMLLLGLSGLSIYAYLPLRYLAQPAFNYIGTYDSFGHFYPAKDLTTWEGVWWVISGQMFSWAMFSYSASELSVEFGKYLHFLWSNFLVIGILPGVWGIWGMWRTERTLTVSLLLSYIANLLFFVNYRVVDKETMFLPTYLIWTLWMGLGYFELSKTVLTKRYDYDDTITIYYHKLAITAKMRYNKKRRVLLYFMFIALVLIPLSINFTYANVSRDWRVYEQARTLLTNVEPNALIFGWWPSAAALEYQQIVEDLRSDVTIINRVFISLTDMQKLISRSIKIRPVYLVEEDSIFKADYELLPVKGGYMLQRRANIPMVNNKYMKEKNNE